MSANSPSSLPELSPPGILLLESYPPLAMALTAALKTFAPRHLVRLATDFNDSKSAAADIWPELLVLDLDPLPGGELDLLLRLQADFASARLLVLAAGVTPAARQSRGDVQFVEKPFELADFGAAVRRSLEIDPGEPVRRLRELRICDLLLLQHFARSSSVLRAQTAVGNSGEIHFRRGQIRHAAVGSLRGWRALEVLAQWPVEKVSEAPLPENGAPSVEEPTDALLLRLRAKLAESDTPKSLGESKSLGKTDSLGETESACPADSLGEPVLTPVPVSTAAATPAAPEGKTILVIDDTEMLRVFVAEVLAAVDPKFQILTAATGQEGLQLALEKQPDLVVLDYSLTDIMGDEVCRALLARETTSRIPVLMMSGHLPELANAAANCRNVVDTLAKPFLSGALIESVARILAAGSLARQLLPNEKLRAPTPETSEPAETPTTTVLLKAVREEEAPPPQAINRLTTDAGFTPSAASRTAQEVRATIDFEVLAVQLTPTFHTGALELRPIEATVEISATENHAAVVLARRSIFHLGVARLNAEGQIETIQFLPAKKAASWEENGHGPAHEHAGAATNGAGTMLQLAPTKTATHVQLSARFFLCDVQFSLGALLLQMRDPVFEKISEVGDESTLFRLRDVQLTVDATIEKMVVEAQA